MRLLLVSMLLASSSYAASRAHYGGILRVAAVNAPPDAEPSLSDTPNEAAVLSLFAQPLCTLDRTGRPEPTLALDMVRPQPTQLRITVKAGLRFSNGQALNVRSVVDAWTRLFAQGTASPYRALFFPLRDGGRQLSGAITPPSLIELSLAFQWPDLERSLCHPALSVVPGRTTAGLGPYLPAPAPGVFVFNVNYPDGRPYAERLVMSRTDERGAAKAFTLNQAQVVMGGAPTESSRQGPALYSTYLIFDPQKVGYGFRPAFEATVDRSDLVRFFVRSSPAVVMEQLLPPSLMSQANAAKAMKRDVPPPTNELTLLYDNSLEDQRAVAERIQIKMHDRGYKIVLHGVPRSLLRQKWASGDYEMMLQGVLLPPIPAPALAIALDLSGRKELLASELPSIGAIVDATARDARARDRAQALLQDLPLIPLYAEGLSLEARPEVENLGFDAQGLPDFADAFLP